MTTTDWAKTHAKHLELRYWKIMYAAEQVDDQEVWHRLDELAGRLADIAADHETRTGWYYRSGQDPAWTHTTTIKDRSQP